MAPLGGSAPAPVDRHGLTLTEGIVVLREALTSDDVTTDRTDLRKVRNLTGVPQHGARIRRR